MFGRSLLLTIGLTVFHLPLLSGYHCGELLRNGDFEENQPAKSWYQYQNPNGWSSVSPDSRSSIVLVGSSCRYWGRGAPAPSGNVYVAVQSGNCEFQQGIQQTLTLLPSIVGTPLLLSFFTSSRMDMGPSKNIMVTVNDAPILSIPLHTYFINYSVVIPITSSTFKVKFVDISPSSTVSCSDHSFLLDKISLIPQSCQSGSPLLPGFEEESTTRLWPTLLVVLLVLSSVLLLACIVSCFYKLHKVIIQTNNFYMWHFY